MESIKDVINQVIGNLATGNKDLDLHRQIFSAWQDVLGKGIIKHTKISGFKNGKLLVFVDSPVFLFYLNLKRPLIRARMQKLTPEFKDINLRIGRLS